VNLADIVENLPATRLAYQEDPYAERAPGTVIRAVREQGSSYYLVLSSTIFHPKGGGQPSDTGSLEGAGFKMKVKKALKAGDHVVLYGKCTGEPSEGPCTQEICWDERYLFMRRHAAAHLFDGVLTSVWGRAFEPLDSWLGEDPYVGYEGDLPSEGVVAKAEEEANRAISEGRGVTVELVKADEISGLRSFWSSVLQDQEIVRLVRIDGYDPIPCAGTHVRNLKEVGGLKVTSTEKTPEGFRVHFDVPHDP
jgi:alanyl-tRNA synthetase